MSGIRWIVASLGVCFLSTPCVADDEAASEVLSLSLTAIHAAASVADSDRYFVEHDLTSFERFRRLHSSEQALAPLRFQRSDTLGRMIEVRGLALVTISENRHSRLFFGVNSDGYLGLHLRCSGDRHIELSRAPWLQRNRYPTR